MDTIKRIKYKTNNCYLIVNDVKAVLVDTCSGGAYETVVKECSNYDMQLIVLTHIHFDHAENAARLSEYFHIPVAFHEADINLFKSYDSQPLKSYGIVGKTVLGISLGTLRNTVITKPKNYLYIKEGDSLTDYGIDARIIEVPGHTQGSIAVDVAEKSLIAGDALDNWIFPMAGHLYTDREKLNKSAERIRSLGERTIYYGHGKPTKNDFNLC